MSGAFSFPPPPPPPPKTGNSHGTPSFGSQARGRGRRRGRGHDLDARGRGRGRGGFVTPDQDRASPRGVHDGSISFRSQPGRMPQYHRQGPQRSPEPSQPINYDPYNGRRDVNGNLSASPSRTFAGHKRKLDALRPPPEDKKLKPQAAPAVPSFGAPILPSKPPPVKSPQVRKLVTKGLGLVPTVGDPDYSSSDDEQVDDDLEDEEALYAELGTKLTFEHNGVVMSLNTAADLAAWQSERRKRFPTSSRVSEREAEKRLVGEERKRLLSSAADIARAAEKASQAQRRPKIRRFSQPEGLDAEDVDRTETVRPSSNISESPLEIAKRELAKKQSRLGALRKQITRGQAALDRALASHAEYMKGGVTHIDHDDTLPDTPPEAQDQGDSDVSSILSESSVVSSETSEDDEQGSEDDGAPQEAPAKLLVTDVSASSTRLCRYYAASGYCRDGETCPFRHELAPGAKMRSRDAVTKAPSAAQQRRPHDTETGRKTIYERLLEQQEEEEDRLALRVIKHLGKAGFFAEKNGREHESNK